MNLEAQACGDPAFVVPGSTVAAQVVNLLRELQRANGLTYLFISHSMPLVRYLCDHVAVMQRGRLVEVGECEQVCGAPREEYTRKLIAATPEIPAPNTQMSVSMTVGSRPGLRWTVRVGIKSADDIIKSLV